MDLKKLGKIFILGNFILQNQKILGKFKIRGKKMVRKKILGTKILGTKIFRNKGLGTYFF